MFQLKYGEVVTLDKSYVLIMTCLSDKSKIWYTIMT